MTQDTTRNRDEIPTWAYRLACVGLIAFCVYLCDARLTAIDKRLERIEIALFVPITIQHQTQAVR